MNSPKKSSKKESTDEFVERILNEVTEKVWLEDPEHKRVQLKLMQGRDSIDDYIIKSWDPECEFK